MSFSKQQQSQASSPNLARLVLHLVLKFIESKALTSDKGGFYFWNLEQSSGDHSEAEPVHPQSVDWVFKAVKACVVLWPVPRMSPFSDCAEVLFLWAIRAFPCNHEAALRNVKVQCVAGRVIGRLQMQLLWWWGNPQRQSVAWLASVLESQQTEGWYCHKTALDLKEKCTPVDSWLLKLLVCCLILNLNCKNVPQWEP